MLGIMVPDAVGTEEFERLSWHDNALFGMRIEVGDPDLGTWHSRLLLDIDHILEWICGTDRRPRVLLAPATLCFEDVTDLKVALDQGESGCQVAMQLPTIDRIERVGVAEQKICLVRPYWRWAIRFNQPAGGLIAFGASGFRQSLRAEPALGEEQRYPADRARPQPF